MKHLKSIVLAAFAAVVAVATISAYPVGAEGSAALSITPKKNYTIEPGKDAKDTLIIRNLDKDQPLNLTLRVVDFTFKDDGGTPKLLLAEDAPQTTWSAKPFLTVPKSVTVEPKESVTVDIGISVPANQGGGSFYSAIVYSSGASDGANVGLSASGVTLAFVNVPGDVKEELKLEKFGAYVPGSSNNPARYVKLTNENPKYLAYTLKNNGNVVEAPVGSITVKPLFGKDKTITDVNPNQSLALIGQTRTYTACFKLKSAEVEFQGGSTRSTTCTDSGLWPGFYRLSLDLYYGQNGNRTQDIQSSSWFIYMPVWAIIVLVLLLLVIGYFGWKAYNAIRGKLGGKPKTKKRK